MGRNSRSEVSGTAACKKNKTETKSETKAPRPGEVDKFYRCRKISRMHEVFHLINV